MSIPDVTFPNQANSPKLWEFEIERVAHLADVHITKAIKRHDEYREVLIDRMCDEMAKTKPDRIAVVGDLYHDKLNVSNEANKLAKDFLQRLSEIAPVRITRGNHDFNIKTKQRMDCIQALVDLTDNSNVVYYNQSGFYRDENIFWVVWHHGDHYSPWNELEKPKEERDANFNGDDIDSLLSWYGSVEELRKLGFKFIDLFHDPVNGCKTSTGATMEKDTYLRLDDFKGDYVMMGDIHLRQHYN